jgi:hypothetical protein
MQGEKPLRGALEGRLFNLGCLPVVKEADGMPLSLSLPYWSPTLPCNNTVDVLLYPTPFYARGESNGRLDSYAQKAS